MSNDLNIYKRLMIIKDINSDRYKIKRPIRIACVVQPDGTYSAFIHELEIFVDGFYNEEDAITGAFDELLYFYDTIIDLPKHYVFHEEILGYWHFLNNHIGLV